MYVCLPCVCPEPLSCCDVPTCCCFCSQILSMYPTLGGQSRLENIVQAAADAYVHCPVPTAPMAHADTPMAPLLSVVDPYWITAEPFRFSFLVFNLINLLMDNDFVPLDWVNVVAPLCKRRLMYPPALHVYHEVRVVSRFFPLFRYRAPCPKR